MLDRPYGDGRLVSLPKSVMESLQGPLQGPVKNGLTRSPLSPSYFPRKLLRSRGEGVPFLTRTCNWGEERRPTRGSTVGRLHRRTLSAYLSQLSPLGAHESTVKMCMSTYLIPAPWMKARSIFKTQLDIFSVVCYYNLASSQSGGRLGTAD
jgi:hypothetical protein